MAKPRDNKKHKSRGDKKASAATGHASAQMRAARAQTQALFTLTTMSNPNPKRIGPFGDRQRILVVGDGDLSFSLSLAVFMGGNNVTATCYDSRSEAQDKYFNAVMNADALETAGATVHFGVDGTALEKQAWLQKEPKFNCVVFNFPHLGGATEEDVVKNQTLLREFFYSSRSVLHPTQGQVLVALRNTLFYNRWEIEEQARQSGFKLKRKERFNPSDYSGYEAQRTHPASFRGEPPSTTGAHYYIFVLDSSLKPEDPRSAEKPESNAVGKARANAPTKKAEKPAASQSMACKICNLSFRDIKKYNGHLNSSKHAKKVKAQKKRP